jgi:hypothetical protein
MKKIAADLIANEMFRLLKKASENDASVDVNVGKKEDDSKDLMSHIDDGDDNIDDIHDFLMDSMGDDGDDASYLDDQISDMSEVADQENPLMRQNEGPDSGDSIEDLMVTSGDKRLMHGLGKIEASLRRKGEGFAADLVRTTALSIQEDIVKEASQKNFVLKNLVKMASDLDRKGEREASKMVKSTIMKINR